MKTLPYLLVVLGVASSLGGLACASGFEDGTQPGAAALAADRKDTPLPGARSAWEKQLSAADLGALQSYFCIADATPAFGTDERANIRMVLEADGVVDTSDELNEREGSRVLTAAKREGKCDRARFRNVFERKVFLTAADEASFYGDLHEALGIADAPSGTETLADARPLVAQYYKKNPGMKPEGVESEDVTPRMYKTLIARRLAR